jgi:hypothetical protein
MLKRSAFIVLVLLCAAVVARAQEPKPAGAPKAATPAKAAKVAAPAKAAPATAAVASEPALPVNIKIEVTITDQTGANPGSKKTVSMIVGDRQRNSIRSSASVAVPMRKPPGGVEAGLFNYRNVTINVDARPAIVMKEPNKISMEFGLEYLPKSAGGAEELEPGMSTLNERLGLVLESGKPVVVSQAADPTSDRRITVEVTATILK